MEEHTNELLLQAGYCTFFKPRFQNVVQLIPSYIFPSSLIERVPDYCRQAVGKASFPRTAWPLPRAQEVDPKFVLNAVAAGRHMPRKVASQLEEETAE